MHAASACIEFSKGVTLGSRFAAMANALGKETQPSVDHDAASSMD